MDRSLVNSQDLTVIVNRFIDLRKQMMNLAADFDNQKLVDSVVNFDKAFVPIVTDLLYSISEYEYFVIMNVKENK